MVGMWSECGRNVVGMWSECGRNEVGMGLTNFFFYSDSARNGSEWLGMTQNGKKSEFEFFARNEVGICSDSYHSAQNLLRSAWIPTILLRSARNVWGRVNYSTNPEAL